MAAVTICLSHLLKLPFVIAPPAPNTHTQNHSLTSGAKRHFIDSSFFMIFWGHVVYIFFIKRSLCQIVGIIWHVAFSYWFLSLIHRHLTFLHVFLQLDCSFLFWYGIIFSCLDVPVYSLTEGHLCCVQVLTMIYSSLLL